MQSWEEQSQGAIYTVEYACRQESSSQLLISDKTGCLLLPFKPSSMFSSHGEEGETTHSICEAAQRPLHSQ
ncbi:hypothetical protein llap_21090 [Limosa lapponica baueri]|uniref:Uncharacterized protein n=1 Tax=Limosa lapponica baueri TaxID=1758121 RepID=A0A2I0T480_LIMLA|nr:hypothetical protein llap_21090 [Limosa lapponica baueri]